MESHISLLTFLYCSKNHFSFFFSINESYTRTRYNLYLYLHIGCISSLYLIWIFNQIFIVFTSLYEEKLSSSLSNLLSKCLIFFMIYFMKIYIYFVKAYFVCMKYLFDFSFDQNFFKELFSNCLLRLNYTLIFHFFLLL